MGNKGSRIQDSDTIDGSGYTLEGNNNPHRQQTFNEGEYAVLETVYNLSDGLARVVWTVGAKRFVGDKGTLDQSRESVRNHFASFVISKDRDVSMGD